MFKLRYTILIWLTLILIPGLLPGCAQDSKESRLVLTDDLGRAVHLSGTPQRIVSLSPGTTEILFALGLHDRVIGVTEFCNYPEEAKAKPKIGGFDTVDREKVVALSPHLILAARIHKDTVIPELERLGLPVFALAAETLDGVLRDISLVGEITGKEKEARQLLEDLEVRINAVTGHTEGLSPEDRPLVFNITWHDPLWTCGSGTLTHDLIQLAGGKNIATDIGGWKTINLETIVVRNPQVIIACTGHGEASNLPYEWARSEPRLKDTTAQQFNRVHQIDADLVNRPGPRVIDALELLAKFIHPEIFGAP